MLNTSNIENAEACHGVSCAQLERDICDVKLWLIETYGVVPLHVSVERHFSQADCDLAGVAVMILSSPPPGLIEAAHEAFLALGYVFESWAADIYVHQSTRDQHSRHEAIQAYARVENALRVWRSA
ncbi:hypothetical protein [Thioclava electrotropha]|uniref:Uncharacterized protein n=1 Tax=Thioclava electrotropha TaxID=1549850 RepID=A0ABX6YV67_9RHOB|nr:hypothetical protein [Thioclava electrotropha]QPZ91199.1 hypothetical protein AKL02_009995 [Thioclava electrotropha]